MVVVVMVRAGPGQGLGLGHGLGHRLVHGLGPGWARLGLGVRSMAAALSSGTGLVLETGSLSVTVFSARILLDTSMGTYVDAQGVGGTEVS